MPENVVHGGHGPVRRPADRFNELYGKLRAHWARGHRRKTAWHVCGRGRASGDAAHGILAAGRSAL